MSSRVRPIGWGWHVPHTGHAHVLAARRYWLRIHSCSPPHSTPRPGVQALIGKTYDSVAQPHDPTTLTDHEVGAAATPADLDEAYRAFESVAPSPLEAQL